MVKDDLEVGDIVVHLGNLSLGEGTVVEVVRKDVISFYLIEFKNRTGFTYDKCKPDHGWRTNSTKLYNYSMVRKNIKKKYDPIEDPWVEENWGYEEISENYSINVNIDDFHSTTAVYCDTREEYVCLLELLEELGYIWCCTREKPTRRIYFNDQHHSIIINKKSKIISNGFFEKDINFKQLVVDKKFKKRTNLDDDPWNEENWGFEEIKEQHSEDDLLKGTRICIKCERNKDLMVLLNFLNREGYVFLGGISPSIFLPEYDLPHVRGIIILSEKKEMIFWNKYQNQKIEYGPKKDDIIVSSDEFMNKNFKKYKYKKIYKQTEDPWNEEDWGFEKIDENINADKRVFVKCKTENELFSTFCVLDDHRYVWKGVERYNIFYKNLSYDTTFYSGVVVYPKEKVITYWIKRGTRFGKRFSPCNDDNIIDSKYLPDFLNGTSTIDDILKIKTKSIWDEMDDPWHEEDWGI